MSRNYWKPNKEANVSVYQQIFIYMKNKIISGEWPDGFRIPSQRKLADEFEVNRSTIVTVLEELKSYGFIEARKGSGTLVNYNEDSDFSLRTINWNSLIQSSIYESNNRVVQDINDLELKDQFIQLGKGELSPSLFPKSTMSQVLSSISNQINYLGYEEAKGFRPLRKAIAQHLREYGIKVSENSVLITSGSLQGLQLISLGLLKTGSTVFLGEPSYLFSLKMFQSAGISLYGIDMDEHGLNVSDIPFSKKYENRSALYCIPSFHNPTGITMHSSRRNEVLKVSAQYNLFVIEDDVYRDLWIDTPPPQPLKAMEETNNVLYVGSLSKSLSPGLRIGWIVANEQVIDRLADIKSQTDYGTSSISQLIAYEWLKGNLYKDHLKAVRRELKFKREVMISSLHQHLNSLATWNIPHGGLFIWIKIEVNISIQRLYLDMLSEGILINPGYIYGKRYQDYIRLSFSYASESEIKHSIAILGKKIRFLSKLA
ncbi:PLP-dependent aminotransferase family protein [Priestia aryabhattai]|uniref:aminotransferase-like domain-containing protein n=1 Tax=Priestia aryabhattai TaxID=412384 RepID=UPI0020401729|nr:PLP-dependent aminotransferase family protein [Priestia aryabhattai]MCM3644904.1 PLP-dependent aminotransferase family protein [Priestia aryabhattai]